MSSIPQRYLESNVIQDLQDKMVFLGGPRQVGKTYLAKKLLKKVGGSYLNWDIDEDRSKILDKTFPQRHLIVLDELHKFLNRDVPYLKLFPVPFLGTVFYAKTLCSSQ